MDLIGPFKETIRGNKYILTLICHYSKWVEIVAIPNKEAITVAKALLEIYQRNGAPHRIITDNGKEFSNQVRGGIVRDGLRYFKTVKVLCRTAVEQLKTVVNLTVLQILLN